MGRSSRDYERGELPDAADRGLGERDRSPLPADALVKYQVIAVAPGISHNLRFILYEDGRLRHAACELSPPETRTQVFNTKLPETPNGQLTQDEVDAIRAAIDVVGFAEESPYVANKNVRDGSIGVVTARVNGTVYEVWYENVSNELTDLLDAVVPASDEPEQTAEEIGDWLRDLTERQSRS
jgi:hypothetical protein